MYWRYEDFDEKVYPGCKPLLLPFGLLISDNSKFGVELASEINYQQRCYESSAPMLNTNNGLMLNNFAVSLPMINQTWQDFTNHGAKGSFAYSVVTVIYSISILAVITWFLNLFVATNYTIKPSLLLRASTTLSSIYLLITVIMAIIELHKQQAEGFLHGAMLFDSINSNIALSVIDLIAVFLLQINQVQVIMRIFLRQKDKRMTFFVGVLASITSQVLWAISQFHSFSDDSEAGDILPAFQYLVRIAMGACYAALISVFILTKINYILANKDIWLITLLTIILIYGPVAFFIADVSNAWVYDLSEIFSVVTYDICVVIPWEWCNKFNSIMKAKEKEGVLGRKFYEDELYELDRFELFVDEEDGNNQNRDDQNDNGNDNNNGNNNNGGNNTNSIKPHRSLDDDDNLGFLRIYNSYRRTKDAFLNITDNVIAFGLGIPRSASVFTGTPVSGNNGDMFHLESMSRRHGNPNGNSITENHVNPNIRFDRSANGMHRTTNSSGRRNANTANNANESNNRRDVFVYSTREVIIDVPDDEHNRSI